jgi:uridine phosphorylase
VGFCPRPARLDRYDPRKTTIQYFVHVAPHSVELCHFEDHTFLSIHDVYGGPVASALIEELAYYGVRNVLAYGLAGGITAKLGQCFMVDAAVGQDGTSKQYTADTTSIQCNPELRDKIMHDDRAPSMTPLRAVTTDAIYREYAADLRRSLCDIVNCDSSHLYAVSQVVGIRAIECGVVSNTIDGAGNDLLALSVGQHTPMTKVNDIVRYYVEILLPEL